MSKRMTSAAWLAPAIATLMVTTGLRADVARPLDPQEMIYNLDTDYQAAVKANDADGMGRILGDDFTLVTGRGAAFSKADLLKSARDKDRIYEHQEDTQKTVRLYGDRTAVVTALLWLKGTTSADKAPFDYKLWFSDVYVKRGQNWQYVFGQASLRLREEK
jgi:ketosteroid isomerase-like protein